MNPSPAPAASSPTPPCPRCGASIPADAPEGLCPRCVAAGNFLTGSLFAGAATRAQAASAAGTAPAPTPEELAGLFPQLEIQRLLGRGGMGVVYLARQKSLDRLVALKLLAPERADDPAFAARFTTEAQALARLHHPHIVTVHDFGAVGGYFYLLMEYIDGLNLRQLQQAGRVEPREALAIVPQICDALQYAHDQGVVHRDIKPENILVDRQGRVRVADFGLAKLTGPDTACETVVMGTPAYMSPEQKSHPDRVDHRTDIYALGAVLYEMLTGARPGTPLQNPSRDVRIDVRLDEVVLRALAHEPALRWQQASEVKTRLETIAATPIAAPRKKRLRELVIAIAVACIATAIVIWIPLQSKPAPRLAPVAPPSPPPAPKIAGDSIDLSPWHTPRELGAKSLTRALDTLHGDHVFDGLAFRVDGQITFAGDAFSQNNPGEKYPAAAEIPLADRRFDALHLLHVSYYENPHGEPVATIRLHYVDGDVSALPIASGVHLRDWSLRPNEESERLDDSDSKIIFRDLEPNQYGATARIFKTRLANPHPDKPVRALELVAAPGLASYSLLAATTANSDPARTFTPAVPSGEKARLLDREILFRVVRRDTGAPVAGALITTNGTYHSFLFVGEPLRTDSKGEARLRFHAKKGASAATQIGANLNLPGKSDQPFVSWNGNFPRIAYFFVDEPAATNGKSKPPRAGLPAWRHETARALLREFGLASRQIRNLGGPLQTLPPEREPVPESVHLSAAQSYADLGALAQGTEGEVLWRASFLHSTAPQGSSLRDLNSNVEASQRLYGAANQAERDFLKWVWNQISPDEPALPDFSQFKRAADTPTVPADRERLRALIAERRKLDDNPPAPGTPEFLPHIKALDDNMRAFFQAMAGTDLDLELERGSSSTSPTQMPLSVHNDATFARMMDLATERGQIPELHELRFKRQDHAATLTDIVARILSKEAK